MTDPFLVEAVSRVALDVAQTQGRVTADDVRASLPNLPYKRSVFGTAFRLLQQEGRLRPDGFVPSRTPSNHGRRIQVYTIQETRTCP